MDEINQVMAMIDAAVGSASSYTESLTDVSDKLGNAKDREGLRAIVESLVATANEMKQNNQALEAAAQRLEGRDQPASGKPRGGPQREPDRPADLAVPTASISTNGWRSAIAEAAERSEPLSLLMTDIDHFKSFNDTWGHLTGDQVLRLVAMSLKQNVKGQDIAARYGGEEFAVILPNTVLRSALTVADHIRRAVMSKELMKRSTGQNLGRVTISLGVATAHKGDTAAVADRARRRLPLRRQAQRPQPGDLRDRPGGRQHAPRPRSPDRPRFFARLGLRKASPCLVRLCAPERRAAASASAWPIRQAHPARRRAARASANTTSACACRPWSCS